MATDREDPEYLLGATKQEVERLQKQHAWIKTATNGKIVFAPVDLQKPGLKILDVGCADGTLLRDLQKHVSPSAKLTGVDIMSQFLPPSPQGNISYSVGDVCQPPSPELAGMFDLTHVRFVLAGAAQAGLEKAIQNLTDTLAPGGWLQIHEMDVRQDADQPTSLNDLQAILGAIFDKTGMGAKYASGLEESLKIAGLQNVAMEKIELPVGKRLENETDIHNSVAPFRITIRTLRQASQKLGLDLAPSVFDNLEERFEREMVEQGGALHCFVVWGQKA